MEPISVAQKSNTIALLPGVRGGSLKDSGRDYARATVTVVFSGKITVDFDICERHDMGTGGTRYGAGRPSWRVKVEHCMSLDVRRFARQKMLQPGLWLWVWRNAETQEETASISVYGGRENIELRYSANGESIQADVAISKSACGFGGSRSWFLCPRCGRRVCKIYLRASRFACRTCQQLSYASQSEDPCSRSWRRQSRLEARLGPDWCRPRYMHQRTHERLLHDIHSCEDARDCELLAFIARHRRFLCEKKF